MLRRLAVRLLAGVVVVGLLAACTPAGAEHPEPAAAKDVGVQLFHWTWDAIAAECPALAEAGYGWVLTSPPQEHVLGEQWWTVYQPVSYRVESRLGTREQLAAMTAACAEVGVDVVADAVVNHMTGQDEPGVGWAGSRYAHYDYPGLWSDAEGHFHHCGLTADDDISRYDDVVEVRSCELVNLADLATETEPVRARLREYLADLVDLGIAGVRIDAAKHMAPPDVEAIVADLPAQALVLSEVIRGPQEPIRPEEYLGAGDVLEFAWGRDVKGIVQGGALRLATELGSHEGSATYLPSDAAWIFVDNHDTERGRQTLSYADGQDYVLANVLMLASHYGRPIVYSGYAFSDRDAGPEQDGSGAVLPATCPEDAGPARAWADGEWVCQHAWPEIAGVVGWRAAVGPAGEDAQVQVDGRVVAFSRGERGWLVVNGNAEDVTSTFETGLLPGAYCDVVAGRLADGACTGQVVEVADGGHATVTVPARSAVAVHVGARQDG